MLKKIFLRLLCHATKIGFLESNLEGKFCLALRLSPDDKGEEETHHEDDTEGYDVPHSSAPLHCQHTECEDQRSCRSTYIYYFTCNSAQVPCNFKTQ